MDPSIYRAARSTDAGIVLASAAVLFTVRAILEQTIVTWVRGVELTGYFPPQSVLDWIGLCCVILALVWAIAVLILSLSAGARLSAGNRWLIAVVVICFALWWIPYQQWKLLVVEVHGTRNVPKDWVVSAAALGETRAPGLLAGGRRRYQPSGTVRRIGIGCRRRRGSDPNCKIAACARSARGESHGRLIRPPPPLEAAQMNHTEIVRLLIDHRANPNAKDVMDRTALDWARMNQNSGMAELVRVRLAELGPGRPESSAARN